MKELWLKPSSEFRYSNLYLDFLKGDARVRNFLARENPLDAAARLDAPRVDRGVMADILLRQNKSFQAKPATFKAIGKYRHDDALCLFTGQQAGLFGGPLLSLYKAIGIVKQAQLLEKRLGRPVVPIFWIAADDHDFEEINHIYFPSAQGAPDKIAYAAAPPQSVSAAEIRFEDETAWAGLKEQMTAVVGKTDFAEPSLTRLFDAYKMPGSFVEAFGQYLLDLLPDIGLVVFSPADKEAKSVSKEFFKKLVEGHFRLKEALEATAGELEQQGYHVQAEKKSSAVHLFYHAPERMAIHLTDDAFAVEDKRLGLPGILDLIDKHPEKFSPDVLTRPLWQSYLFSVVAQAGGPSEIAYFCQIGKLFEIMGLVQPYYFHRPALTIIEKRQEELLDRYGLTLNDFAGDVETLISRITALSFPRDMEAQITQFKERFENAYNEFFAAVRKFDESLEPMGKQTYGKVDFAIGALEKKIYDQHKKRMETTRNHIYRLSSLLFPNRNLQERTLNINYYLAKYGFGFIDFLVRKIDSETTDHQLILLSEYLA